MGFLVLLTRRISLSFREDFIAKQVVHFCLLADGLWGAKRESTYGSDVIFELTCFTPLDSPVTGIMDSWCHFVEEQFSFIRDKELDSEDAHIVHSEENPLGYFLCSRLYIIMHAAEVVGCTEYPSFVLVFHDGVETYISALRPYSDDGHFFQKINFLFENARNVAELFEGGEYFIGTLNKSLTLAVIGTTSSFDSSWEESFKA